MKTVTMYKLALLCSLFVIADANLCVVNETTTTSSPGDFSIKPPKIYVPCPSYGYSKEYTECCEDEEYLKRGQVCCKPESNFQQSLIIIIVVAVVFVIIAAVIIVACAFWSKCPMYNIWKTRLSSDITFGVEAGPNAAKVETDPILNMRTMPKENSEKVFFWPKISLKPDGKAPLAEV